MCRYGPSMAHRIMSCRSPTHKDWWTVCGPAGAGSALPCTPTQGTTRGRAPTTTRTFTSGSSGTCEIGGCSLPDATPGTRPEDRPSFDVQRTGDQVNQVFGDEGDEFIRHALSAPGLWRQRDRIVHVVDHQELAIGG